tara:strand:- start:510 stop:1502 length:993 start_codon:yes stop_codon:yes gene_type:complete
MSFSKRFMSGSPFRVDKAANVKVPAKIKAPVEKPMSESEKKLMHATMSVNDKYAVDLGTVKNTKKEKSPLLNSAPSYSDKRVGYAYFNKLNNQIGKLAKEGLSDHDIQNHPSVKMIKANKAEIILKAYQEQNPGKNIIEAARDLNFKTDQLPDDFDFGAFSGEFDSGNKDYSGPYADSWNNNFKIENGQRVGKYHTYSDDEEGFANYVNAAQAWNADQQNNNVVEEEEVVVNPDNVEVITDVVDPNAHVPAEGINVMSGKQKRAANKVARLMAKNAKQGSLTEGQSKRLNRNISKAKGEDVAMADRTKLGQIANQAGNALGIIPDEEEVV